MGMETTWDEIRIAVLQKMMVIEGNTVENNDSTAYFLAAMPAAYNEAVRLLSTTNRYITKVYEQPADGLTQTMMIDLQKAIPDLFQLKANGIYFTDLHGKTISYYGQSMQGTDLLLLSNREAGKYRIYYYAYPLKVTSDTAGNTDLQIDPDVASLIPLYIASQLYKDDELGTATIFRNEFEAGRELLVKERNDSSAARFVCKSGWWE